MQISSKKSDMRTETNYEQPNTKLGKKRYKSTNLPRNIQRSQTSSAIRKMQIKMLINYLFTTIRLEHFKSTKE